MDLTQEYVKKGINPAMFPQDCQQCTLNKIMLLIV